MKIFKRILLVLLVVLILIQFFRPQRNISASPSPADISTIYPVPANVGSILKKACYDCHSNNTNYPWYANVQPIAWWLNDHVEEGKRGLTHIAVTPKKNQDYLGFGYFSFPQGGLQIFYG